MTATRGRAPWDSGGRSVSRECWAVCDQGVPHPGAVVARVAARSHRSGRRDPRPGAAWSSGIRAARMTSPSSPTRRRGSGPRRRRRGPPTGSGCRCAARSSRSNAASACAFDAGRGRPRRRCAGPALTSSVAVSVLESLDQHLLGLGPQRRVGGQGVDGIDRRPRPAASRSDPHGRPSTCRGSRQLMARACRTFRFPSRLDPPTRWANQSAVEAHCNRFLGSSRTSTSASIETSNASIAPRRS